MTADTMAPLPHQTGYIPDGPDVETDCVGLKRHALPVLKVTLPYGDDEPSPSPAPHPEADDEASEALSRSLDLGPMWKLDRRDSGSLFWRRDSIANKNSKVKFRCDVDVREFSPREGEHVPDPVPDSASEDEDDIYNDDYILLHGDEIQSSWLRPSNLFRRCARRARRHSKQRESSVYTSLVCVFAILLTAYVQFTFVR